MDDIDCSSDALLPDVTHSFVEILRDLSCLPRTCFSLNNENLSSPIEEQKEKRENQTHRDLKS